MQKFEGTMVSPIINTTVRGHCYNAFVIPSETEESLTILMASDDSF